MIVEGLQYLAGLFLLAGGLFAALSGVGLLRFPDLYTRMHAASKAGALGVGLVFLAVAVISLDIGTIVKGLIGVLFVLITAPLAAHLLARAALHSGTKVHSPGGVNEYSPDA